jgi:hypothetical protein
LDEETAEYLDPGKGVSAETQSLSLSNTLSRRAEAEGGTLLKFTIFVE